MRVFSQAGAARHRLEDARHLARIEPHADPHALAARANQPSIRDAGPFQPRAYDRDCVLRNVRTG